MSKHWTFTGAFTWRARDAHAWYLQAAASLHNDFACGNENGVLA